MIFMVVLTFVGCVVMEAKEKGGYKDKMVISYHCPEREYDRQIISQVMNDSGVFTNFINRECTMDKYSVKYRLTNPK